MPIDGGQLLKRLEPLLRSAGGSAATGARRADVDSPSFDRMLALVSRSSGVAGRSVMLRFQPEPALDAQQMARLSAAAEVAAGAGAERALMLIDGRALVMEVGERQLAAELCGSSSQHELVELDAAVYVAPASGDTTGREGADDGRASVDRRRSIVPPGIRSWVPPGIAAQLEAATRADGIKDETTIEM